MADEELKRLSRIVCEWDENRKGECKCANAPDFPVEDWCKGCTGIAKAVLAAGYAPVTAR